MGRETHTFSLFVVDPGWEQVPFFVFLDSVLLGLIIHFLKKAFMSFSFF